MDTVSEKIQFLDFIFCFVYFPNTIIPSRLALKTLIFFFSHTKEPQSPAEPNARSALQTDELRFSGH